MKHMKHRQEEFECKHSTAKSCTLFTEMICENFDRGTNNSVGTRFPRDQRGSDQTAPFPDPYVHPKEVSITSSCPLAPPRAPPMGPAIHFEAMKRRNRSQCSKKGIIRAVSEGFMKFSMSDRGSFTTREFRS